MIYPPPPGLALLAYQFGTISKAEFEWCLKKWNEKHSQEDKEMRLIDADALADWVLCNLNDQCFDDLTGRQAANLIGKAIDESPTVYAWHSQEEIPPQKGIYLVYAKKHFIPDHVDDPNYVWMLQLAYYDEKIGWLINEVKWWTELPEPPKEE